MKFLIMARIVVFDDRFMAKVRRVESMALLVPLAGSISTVFA